MKFLAIHKMFLAILVHRDQKMLFDQIEDKTVYYLFGKEHSVLVANSESISNTIQSKMHPIVYDTGFYTPVRAFQHLEYLDQEIVPDAGTLSSTLEYESDFEVNRKLMAIRSRLAYASSELFGPDRFTFQMDIPRNSVGTRRQYVYTLKFSNIPCYYFEGSPVFDQISEIMPQMETGPLICSSLTISQAMLNPPEWYLKEIFRDIVQLEQVPVEDKILIDGPITGNVYLFYKGVVNVTEGQLEDFIEEVNETVRSYIQTKTFPRNTPQNFVKTRHLQLIQNNQWSLGIPELPVDTNLFKDEIQISLSFRRTVDFFWFLFWLMLAPTYSFIEKELQVNVQTHLIQIYYNTQYYPDYLRVLTASRCRAESPSEDDVLIYYPNQLSKERVAELKKGGTYISFYDNENHEPALIIADNFKIPELKLEQTIPKTFSLETRREYDYDLDAINQMIGGTSGSSI